MRFHINKFLGLLLFSTLTISGCSYVDGFTTDPNNATDGPITGFFVSAQVGTILEMEGEDARMANIFTQQFTGTARQAQGFNSYLVAASDFDWVNSYFTVIEQSNQVIKRAKEIGNLKLEGASLVLKAQIYGKQASLYGDIPFTESNQFEEGILTPTFDDQVSIVYPGIQGMLDEAITKLGGVGSIDGDIYFSGDASKWIAVANTLKARFYLEVGDYASAITAANNGVSAVANDMSNPHGDAALSDINIWYDFHQNQRNGDLTDNSSVLAGLLDPSSTSYRGDANTNEAARFAFFFTGTSGEYDLNVSSTGMFAADASFPIVTYYENQLTLAEAAFRTGDRTTALTALNAVRTALATQYSTTYNAYVDADLPGDALITEIMEERYISLAGQLVVFNDMRRNVSGKVSITPTVGSKIPQRFFYPQNEIDTNPNTPTLSSSDLFSETKANGGTK